MSGVRRPSLDIMRRNMNSEVESEFKRRTPGQRRCWTIPRRYQVAVMCFLAFLIDGWMLVNLLSMFIHIFSMAEKERQEHFPQIANWTIRDLDTHLDLNDWGGALIQMPAAILTFHFSSHKIMLLSVVLSSILHIITPLVIHCPLVVTGSIIFLQGITAGPTISACMCILKDWVPLNERTSLLVLAFSGRMINLQIFLFLSLYLVESVGPFSIYTITGIAGIVWGILWYSLIFESPSSDPLITAEELSYLEERVPAENNEKITVKSIPFKSILLSPSVLTLLLVFFSVEMLRRILMLTGIFLDVELESAHYDWHKNQWFYFVNYLFLLPASGFLVDFLINRLRFQTQMMRKIFCSGGLILHAVFLLLILIPDTVTSYVCYIFSLVFLSLSFVGYIPNVLEISPRFVSVIIAMCTMVFRLSGAFFEFILEAVYSGEKFTEFLQWKELYVGFGIFGLITGIVFAVFASSDEQSWSQTTHTSFSKPQDSKCYPRNEVEDDTLVSETV